MLLNIEKAYPEIVRECRIQRFRQDHYSYEYVATLHLCNETTLYVKDYLFADGTHKYAYHWQDATEGLIARWDNAMHWPELNSFPHHIHLKNAEVVESKVRSLSDALDEIVREMNSNT